MFVIWCCDFGSWDTRCAENFVDLFDWRRFRDKLLGVIFFENKLLLQSDVVFDPESNGRNFSSLASIGGEKKIFPIFLQNDVTRRRGRFYQIKIIIFAPSDGARELKLWPFDSESKTTSDCSNSLFLKKINHNSLFSFYH